MAKAGMAYCPACKSMQPASSFKGPRQDGFARICGRCKRKGWWSQGEMAPEPKKVRERAPELVYWKYPLTAYQHKQLKAQQQGRCAICGKSGRLVVDHCHDEHQLVRGMLCGGCNAGLGFFRDDPDVMRRAAKYVEEPILGRVKPPTREQQIVDLCESRARSSSPQEAVLHEYDDVSSWDLPEE